MTEKKYAIYKMLFNLFIQDKRWWSHESDHVIDIEKSQYRRNNLLKNNDITSHCILRYVVSGLWKSFG